MREKCERMMRNLEELRKMKRLVSARGTSMPDSGFWQLVISVEMLNENLESRDNTWLVDAVAKIEKRDMVEVFEFVNAEEAVDESWDSLN
jgi:hypothetical protein